MQGDAAASREAGIPIVYAKYGFGVIDQPDYIINGPTELIDLLKSIVPGHS